MLVRFVAPLCLALLCAPAAASAPLQREFRDWVLTCDNTRDCLAEGLDADNPTLVVRFARRAGPAGGAAARRSAARA
jgi:Protein of unknown function (DUF1176)